MLSHRSFENEDDLAAWVSMNALTRDHIQAIVMDSSGLVHLFYWDQP